MNARSGSYQVHPDGYRMFIPISLPPDPPLKMDPSLENILSEADRAIGRLDGIGRMLPNPDLFITMYMKKEAVLSSQIEGIQTTFPDLLESEGGKPLNELPEDLGEVVNYISASKIGLRMIKEKPISISLIKDIHAVLLRDIRGYDRDPGRFRDRPVGIGPPGCDLHSATFIPPSPSEVMRLMEELSVFIESQENIPPLILCGLVHSQFETIHPFRDGNGRLGRLLITLLLCRKGVLSYPLLYLSHFFLRNRGEYYNSLMMVRDDGNWEGWLRFFLRGVYIVSNEAVEKTGKILELKKKDSYLIREMVKRGKSLEFLELLLIQPVISLKTISENIGVAFATAGSLAEDFVKAGILDVTSDRKRNRLFTYTSYIKLLTAENPRLTTHPPHHSLK